MTATGALHIQLSLQRPRFSLDVDLTLPSQGITVLFGPSGSGKTTVLRCVAGLEQPLGRVIVGHEVWQDSTTHTFRPTWRRDLGYVFQEASLFEHLTVHKNLAYGVSRVARDAGTHALTAAIELLGIGHLLDRRPSTLSGGERQRVAIARALATQPKILLLDEPLSSLDLARRQEVLPWLDQLHRELQIPVLYVTHAMEELTRLADHVVLMHEGTSTMQGPVSELLSNVQFARRVGLDAGSVLSGEVEAHDPEVHLSRIRVHDVTWWVRQMDLSPGSPVRLHIRANDVSLALSEPQDSSIQNRVQGIVESIVEDAHPAQCIVSVRCDGGLILSRVTLKAVKAFDLSVGRSVWCQIKSVALSR